MKRSAHKWTWARVLFTVLALATIGSAFGISGAEAATYPANFLWGAALSAHQTEGAWGGGSNGDWWQFEHSTVNGTPTILNGDTADVAVDHWHRYKEDFQIAHDIGLNTVRISIAWEKVEPQPGVFSSEVIEHYRDVLKSMHAQGLRPMVALHHFTHPRWFNDQGGWTSDRSPELFARYADFVVSNLKDLCDLWITFNEPMVLVNSGYLSGTMPPGIKGLGSAIDAAFNLARAHRIVVAMIHERQPPNDDNADGVRGVGVVNSLQLYEPKQWWNIFDNVIAGFVEEFANWAFLDAAIDGHFLFTYISHDADVSTYERELPASDLARTDASPVADWIGVNYYTKYQVHLTWKFRVEVKGAPGPAGDNGWTIYPEGLEEIVRHTADRWDLPLIVSENGLADADDSRRPDFIRQSLAALDRLMDDPELHVRGYYHWSLTDNFEWLQGYQKRFGLVEIRYDDGLKRVPRPSAGVYRDEIQRRR